MKKRKTVIASICCTGIDVFLVLFLSGSNSGKIGFWVVLLAVSELIMGAWIAYGRRKIVSGGLLLFVVTALLAGFFQMVPIRNIGVFCFVGTVLFPLLTGGIRTLFRTKQTQNWIYDAHLYQNGEEKILSAFLDTGNRLRLYGSRLPVVVVDETHLTEWIKAAEERTPQKLVFLPYKGVGGRGLLHGVRLHCVLNLGNDKLFSGEVAAVAAEHSLFRGCDYQMILQPEILSMACVTDTREGEQNVV